MATKAGAGAAAPKPAAKADLGDTIESVIKWRDRIKKEMRHMSHGAAAEFSVNTRTLKGLTPNIGVEDKVAKDPEATLRREEDVKKLKETIIEAQKPPQEKYRAPLTSAQEVGWFYREAEKDPFRATATTCEEVKYATRYYESFHTGPYNRSAAAGAAAAATKKA
jgi:hypothetical protein